VGFCRHRVDVQMMDRNLVSFNGESVDRRCVVAWNGNKITGVDGIQSTRDRNIPHRSILCSTGAGIIPNLPTWLHKRQNVFVDGSNSSSFYSSWLVVTAIEVPS
jgi:hypothetical protein